MTNIQLQKRLESYLELQNANMFENIEEDFEEPDHLKDEESIKRAKDKEENENSQVKEISSESMEKVIKIIISLLILKNLTIGEKLRIQNLLILLNVFI